VLREGEVRVLPQVEQRKNPDGRIILEPYRYSQTLKSVDDSRYGLRTGDAPRLIGLFWEQASISDGRWRLHQGVPERTELYAGREHILWDDGRGALTDLADQGIASLQGVDAWGRAGLVVGLMRDSQSPAIVEIFITTIVRRFGSMIMPISQRSTVSVQNQITPERLEKSTSRSKLRIKPS
jgi:hypothetical protein